MNFMKIHLYMTYMLQEVIKFRIRHQDLNQKPIFSPQGAKNYAPSIARNDLPSQFTDKYRK